MYLSNIRTLYTYNRLFSTPFQEIIRKNMKKYEKNPSLLRKILVKYTAFLKRILNALTFNFYKFATLTIQNYFNAQIRTNMKAVLAVIT